ncbi:hypothetical protein O181_038342 [Austropuccinia psidii MF-1]|uniref:Uncharacterized protein n=1 Tax=Austropuccinia psidii MF-1 TaxID=1389203 RepID=A0A9Q3HBT2_9BASI|nr:hypothetical protein [Austropuccinia psidii MF-1]
MPEKNQQKHHTFEAAKDSRDQGDEMINVDVDHIDNEPPHTESPPILNEAIHDETPLASPQNIQAFQERETIKHDTMGQDMTDIMPDPEPKVSSSPNVQGIFLSRIEEFGDILTYHSNITQESWKRGLDNINSIYKSQCDNSPTNDAHKFLPLGIKVISNQELKILAWLEELEMTGLDFFKPTETEAFFDNNIWNLKFMKESANPLDNLPKSEHSFKMVQSLLYPANTIKHFWANVMFESISLVSYNVIAPKPYVAPASNLTDPLGLKQGAVEYLASCLSKLKQHATQLSIEGGGADNEILTQPHKNLEDLMDTVIHLMIAYNMVCAHTKVEVYGMKGKLTSSKKNEAIKDLLSCHKNLRVNQIYYGILEAFCVARVCGLMVCLDDWITSLVKGDLSLIDISKRLSEGKNLLELVWLCTNKYICNLLNKSFFSSESFNPTVTLRFEFA